MRGTKIDRGIEVDVGHVTTKRLNIKIRSGTANGDLI